MPSKSKAQHSDVGCCGEQPILRGLIMTAAIFLLGIGGAIFVIGLAGFLDLLRPELQRTAQLLKVPANITEPNLLWAYKVLGATGYATANIATVAICAVAGRRRVHVITGLATSGAGGVVYLMLLLGAVKPKIGRITQAMEAEQRRYFQAYDATGDERYISQIQLHSGCCGLLTGPEDFTASRRKTLPSSCCGMISGNCSASSARRMSCGQAIRKVIGFDGLMGLSPFVLAVGGTCCCLSALLLLMLISTGQDTVELLIRLRHRTQDAWRRKARTTDADRKSVHLLPRQLGFGAQLSERDREMHRMMARAAKDRKANTASAWSKMRIGKSEEKRMLQSDSPTRIPNPGAEPQKKAKRGKAYPQSLEDRLRQTLATAADEPDYRRGSLSHRYDGNVAEVLERKLRQEAEIEAERLKNHGMQ